MGGGGAGVMEAREKGLPGIEGGGGDGCAPAIVWVGDLPEAVRLAVKVAVWSSE